MGTANVVNVNVNGDITGNFANIPVLLIQKQGSIAVETDGVRTIMMDAIAFRIIRERSVTVRT